MSVALQDAVMERPSHDAGGDTDRSSAFTPIIRAICNLNWSGLAADQLVNVAWAYYYFSVQFRENLDIARKLHPEDERLADLEHGEKDTDNLSPWPGVAAIGEKMHHDEFMRRTLMLVPVPEHRRRMLEALGADYLAKTRSMSDAARAMSIASYEDGGLEAVFTSFLKAPHWDGPLLAAFRHFVAEHIRFDSDPDGGHGALCRHLTPDDRIAPLWQAFYDILVQAEPSLAS